MEQDVGWYQRRHIILALGEARLEYEVERLLGLRETKHHT